MLRTDCCHLQLSKLSDNGGKPNAVRNLYYACRSYFSPAEICYRGIDADIENFERPAKLIKLSEDGLFIQSPASLKLRRTLKIFKFDLPAVILINKFWWSCRVLPPGPQRLFRNHVIASLVLLYDFRGKNSMKIGQE